MRVTFVLPFAGLQGGIRVVAIYAKRLKERGHEVVVISTPPESSFGWKVRSFIRGGWRTDLMPSHFDHLDVEHRVLDRVRPVTDVDVPDSDVVMATYYTTAYGVLRLSPSKGAKAILLQGYELLNGKPTPKLDATWRMPMHKIAVSNWLAQLARDKFGDETASLVPNGVDLDQFHAVPRDKNSVPTVGFLIHNEPLKGCGTSIAAVKRVVESIPSLRLISFGAEHPDFGLRLPRFGEFHYQPPQEKIRDLYAQCDVWLSTSILEGFCLPLLEAMACRCPVVSTRAGGPIDILEDGVNGYLTEVADVDALADRVLRLLRLPPEDWRKMSDAAYRTATRFNWNDATVLFEEALELTIARKRRGEI
ncbi:MAG: glycosyltransferase [Nitrospira sp. LK70]|nr:glycosyltransferase [Nitrospira sp. LK70]